MNTNRQTGPVMGILFLISASHFLNDTMQSLLPASLPLLREANALTFTEVGLITLTVQLTSSLLQPVIGHVTDKNPRPYALPFGMLLTLMGLVSLAYATSLTSILISVAAVGCGSAVFHPESARVAQKASGGRKGLAQAIFQVGGNAGSAVGPIAAAIIIIPNGQTSIAWFAPAAACAAFFLWRVAGWAKKEVATKKAVISEPLPPVSGKVLWIFAILFLLMFSKQVYVSSLTNFLTFFSMEKFGIDAVASQYVLFAFLASGAAGTLIGGPITDRFGKRNVMLGSIVGAAPFALAIPYVSLTWVVILTVIVSFIISSAFSAILVCALEAIPGRTGAVSGIFFGLSFGLGGVATAFFGWLADNIGIANVFVLASFLPLLGLSALALPKKI